MDFDAVFFKPFEVTNFWINADCVGQSLGDDDGYVIFRAQSDQPKKWSMQAALGAGRPFAGDYIDPFLPTRHNISVLNAAVRSMAEIARESERTGDFTPPNVSPVAAIEASPVPVSRNINDERYRIALFDVLAKDWGISLPDSPSDFGRKIIRLEYRPGLPCGPAMISAVEPILYQVWGAFKKDGIVTGRLKNMTIDTVSYKGESFTSKEQIFDITDYFGRSLPNSRFQFDLDNAFTLKSVSADEAVISSLDMYLEVVASEVSKGNDPFVSCASAYQALTGMDANMGWMISRPSLIDMCEHFVQALHERQMTGPERENAEQIALRRGFLEVESSKIIWRTPDKKMAWWKFWN